LSDKIDIITYSKAELRKLLEEPLWWDHTNLPFTKSRLSCYLDSPHSRDDDILWLIAWQEERIVAYLGLAGHFVACRGSFSVSLVQFLVG